MTASDPAETKDKERTEATPVEEAQQGIDWIVFNDNLIHCVMNHQAELTIER